MIDSRDGKVNEEPRATISAADFDAVVFDMDGVVTQTASVHAAARKRLFDACFEQAVDDLGEVAVVAC